MEWTNAEKNELFAKIQKLAATDEEFRKSILADPKATVEKISSKKLPENAKIKVIEHDPAYTSTLVLPKFVGEELEEDDLDNVAGGGFLKIAVIITIGIL